VRGRKVAKKWQKVAKSGKKWQKSDTYYLNGPKQRANTDNELQLIFLEQHKNCFFYNNNLILSINNYVSVPTSKETGNIFKDNFCKQFFAEEIAS